MPLPRTSSTVALTFVATLGLFACRGDDATRHPTGLVSVAAELKTPVHAVVRVFEYDVKPECTETGLKALTCFFKSELRGCTWLDVGGAAGRALEAPPGPAEDFCLTLHDGRARRRLELAPLPSRGMELVADPTGTRLAWRASPSSNWSIFYVLGEDLLDDRGASSSAAGLDVIGGDPHPPVAPPGSPGPGPLDWSKVPTLNARAPLLVGTADRATLPRLFELIRQEHGDARMGELLAEHLHEVDDGPWRAELDRLGEAGRKALEARVARLLESELPDDLIYTLMERPELRPPGFSELLVRGATEHLDSSYEEELAVAPYLEALVALKDPRAGALGCRHLENLVVRKYVAADEYAYLDGAPPAIDAALIAIARFKTPCPWVTRLLERRPCDLDYRCTPQGLVENSEAAIRLEEEAMEAQADSDAPLPPAEPQHRLCTEAEARREVDRWVPAWAPWPTEDEDEGAEDPLADPPPPGTLLLSAAYAQGPLPADFLSRNRRRLYAVSDLTPKTELDDVLDTSQCQLLDEAVSNPAEIACRVPP